MHRENFRLSSTAMSTVSTDSVNVSNKTTSVEYQLYNDDAMNFTHSYLQKKRARCCDLKKSCNLSQTSEVNVV